MALLLTSPCVIQLAHVSLFGYAVPNSVLFLGRPGVGKTTVIREMARVLSDELHKRVVIVDTSNEIGGDGDVPHPAIGGARRMQVPDPSQQHKVMVSMTHSPPEVTCLYRSHPWAVVQEPHESDG